jgi:hypothetical protein
MGTPVAKTCARKIQQPSQSSQALAEESALNAKPDVDRPLAASRHFPLSKISPANR